MQANKSKIVSKTSYFILLLFAAAATVITVFACSWDEQGDGENLQNPLQVSAMNRRRAIIGLSLATAILTGLTTFLKPTERWMELRGGALTLESEVWKFRTRSGPYRPRLPRPGGRPGDSSTLRVSRSESILYGACVWARRALNGHQRRPPAPGAVLGQHKVSDESVRPEKKLHEVLTFIQNHISKAGSVSETGFYSTVEIFGGVSNKDGERTPKNHQLYRHGQYAGCRIDGTFGYSNTGKHGAFDVDDHQAPLNPESYLHLRVEPAVRFYQRRIPRYYASRWATEALLLLGSLSGTLLAFLKADQWFAIVCDLAIGGTVIYAPPCVFP